jgi:OOP family OmpA-OmpF porin
VVQPPPPKPALVNISSTVLFEFDKATLTPQAQAQLEREVVARMGELREVRYIRVSGHADRVGGESGNLKLSERRAEAVRGHLIAKGLDRTRVGSFAFGNTRPVATCAESMKGKALVDCLAPNRRVEVEIQGAPR